MDKLIRIFAQPIGFAGTAFGIAGLIYLGISSPRVLFNAVPSRLRMVRAVTRSVSRRLGSFGVSRRVFDNFNGAESPWVRLVALLDLSETRPLSALADSIKSIGLADTHFSKAQNRGNSSFWAVSPMLKSLGNAYT